MSIFRKIAENKILYFSLVGAFFLCISLLTNLSGDFKVTDPDGFYHIKHAWLYRTNGIFDTSFPWTQYSVIRTLGGDLWYGFHIFLIPFTFGKDLVWGVKISGVVITCLALFLYFLSFRRLKLKLPLLWPALLPFISPILLARLGVTRPHPISLGLNILLVSFLINGGVWPVFFIGFFISFIHLNLFWVPILTLFIICVSRIINGNSLEKNKIIALLSGITAGVFLRPHPIATLELNYTQLIYLMIQKLKGLRLAFGFELYPLGLTEQPPHLLIIFAVLTLLFAWLVKKHISQISLTDKITAWTLMVLTTLYLVLTIFVVRRAVDFFIGYLLLFAAFVFTFYFKFELDKSGYRNWNFYGYTAGQVTKFILTITLISLVGYGSLDLIKGSHQYLDWLGNSYRSQASMAWLQKNTKPGEIIFHFGWENFPELFFWNTHNRYLSGMDPIFMFTYDQNLYWESHFLAIGQGTDTTCSFRRCVKQEVVRTYDVIKDHFKASYVFIRPKSHPAAFAYLDSSKKEFQRMFFDGNDAIFEVLKDK